MTDAHLCHCGKWGAFGHGVFLNSSEPGTWYCGDHRPGRKIGTPRRVWLTRDLLVKCWRTAKARYDIKPGSNKQVSTRPGFELNFDGLRSECALAQFVERPDLMDLSVNPFGDNGVDLVLGGKHVQVKSTSHFPPLLAFDIEGSAVFKAELAVLAHLPLPPRTPDEQWAAKCGWVDLIGWITRSEFLERATVHNFGHMDRLALGAPLGDMVAFKDMVR